MSVLSLKIKDSLIPHDTSLSALMPLMYLHTYEVMCFLVAKASEESNNTAPDKRSGPEARHTVRQV